MKRTAVYIDGFNLYYGCLKKTPYKWLDLRSLFTKLIGDEQTLVELKYFTARVNARNGDNGAALRQKLYLQALQAYIPELSIHYGHYLTSVVTARLSAPLPNQSPYAKVFKTEEKGSDVNIALHVLNDAWLDRYDIAIIVSNDSDLLEAIQLVKKHHKEKKVGVALPLLNENRNPSRVLTNNADFVKHIRRHALESSQLPNPIPGASLYQPESWRSI